MHSLLVSFLRQSPLCNSGFPRAMHNRLLQTPILLPWSIKLRFSLLSSQFGGGRLKLLAQVAFLPQQLRDATLEQHLQSWAEAGGNMYRGQAAVHALPAISGIYGVWASWFTLAPLYNCGLSMRKDIPAWSWGAHHPIHSSPVSTVWDREWLHTSNRFFFRQLVTSIFEVSKLNFWLWRFWLV